MSGVGQEKIKFGTKAETLERLSGRLTNAVVDELIKFTVMEWRENSKKILDHISSKFFSKSVIVRSSARVEDCYEQSNAGHFTSIGNIDVEPLPLAKAIEDIINKYDDRPDNQIFVQEYIAPAEISGVVFTRDINSLSPYIVINYDDTSGSTDTITSGRGKNQKTLIIFKGRFPKNLDDKLNKIYRAIVEVEQKFDTDALDIEFIYKNNIVHIAQVRPITVKVKNIPKTKEIGDVLDNMCERLKEFNLPHPDLYGEKTLYGIMPDWNPAEMIGVKPRPLSLSLYRELITDSIWSFQRDNYGYKRLRSFPLLISLAGHPYIDVRVDFNSFIPKSLDDNLSHKLTNFYLNKLKSMPSSHDKIEFDIVFSCYTLNLDERLQELQDNDFTAVEIDKIKESLLVLTNNIINPSGLYKDDLKKIKILEERFKELNSSNLSIIKKIYWLVEDCKRYGTLPFAGIARAAFIAVQLLNSLVSLKIISVDEKNLFLNSLNTIAKQISNDIKKLSSGKISLEQFIKAYGHLRPGTYDILSESYEENFHKYFDLDKNLVYEQNETKNPFSFSAEQMNNIDVLLKTHSLGINAEEFLLFVKEATEGREYAKYIFTKNINELLKLIKIYGERLNFTADDLSYVEINTLLKLNSTVAVLDEARLIRDEIERNRTMYEFYKHLKLPYLISEPEDIYSFYISEIEPNYITNNKTGGEVVLIHPGVEKKEIKGKIVLIEGADPGFDWIFSHQIKGLITAYGGANSHMAIRAAELGLPAVIGCGPALFEKWGQAKKIEIDCANKMTTIIS